MNEERYITTQTLSTSTGSRLAGVAAAIGAVVIWGLTFVPTKLALAEMGPFTLAVLRFVLALAMLLAIARREPLLAPLLAGRRTLFPLALMGLTGVTLYFGLQNLSLGLTSATEAGLIAGAVPAITAALSSPVLHERIGRMRGAGIAASVGGVAVVVLAAGAAGQSGSMLGDLLMLGAALAWVAYTLVNKRMGGGMAESVTLIYTMAFGLIFLVPGAIPELIGAGFGPVSSVGWLSVLFLGLGGSGTAFLLWNIALRKLDASEATAYINLVPVVTVVSAAAMLGESATPAQWVGGTLVIAGVYLAGR